MPTVSASPSQLSSPTSVVGSDVGKTSSGLPTIGETANDLVVGGFEGMGEDFPEENTQLSAATSVVKPAAPATLQQPAAPAAAAPQVPAPTAPAAPAAQPQAPAAAVTAEPPASTEAHSVTAEAILDAIAKDGPGFIEALAPQFAVSPELALELEADYAAAVPKLLANVYMKSTATAVDYIQRLVPAMIERHLTNARVHQEAESEFFGQFPGLSKAKHGADIVSMAKAFQASNPRMSKSDMFQFVGAAVMAKHGIAGGQRPAVPAAHVPQPAFTPAGSGPSTIIAQSQVDAGQNLFDGMGRDYE